MKIIDRRDILVPSSGTARLENLAYRGMENPVNGYHYQTLPVIKISSAVQFFFFANGLMTGR